MVRELVAVIVLAMNGTSFGTIGVNGSETVTETRLVLFVFGIKELSVRSVAPEQ